MALMERLFSALPVPGPRALAALGGPVCAHLTVVLERRVLALTWHLTRRKVSGSGDGCRVFVESPARDRPCCPPWRAFSD